MKERAYKKTLIVGSGRLAKHLSHYFKQQDIPFVTWTRQSGESLSVQLSGVDRVCLCISDSALADFVERTPSLKDMRTIHFSAVTEVPGISWAHPLMTFGPELYNLEDYARIPFLLDRKGPKFNELFPELKNEAFYIPQEKRALYHALCVMSGNFTTILWQTVFRRFESDLNLNREILLPYLRQVTKNLSSRPEEALTGPLVRGDTNTVIKHLDSLRDLPEQQLYYAFLNYVLADRKTRGEVTHEHLRI